MLLDLSSLPSIDEFSKQFRSKYSHLDLLINNGGLNTKGTIPLGDKKIEQLFGVNYLGHYYLFRRVQDLLHSPNPSLGGVPSRVVNLSSVTHHQGSSNFINSCYFPILDKIYDGCSPYADSKLYMNFLTLEINRRFSGSFFKGTSSSPSATNGPRIILSLSVNPGAVKSDIWRSVPSILQLPYNHFMSVFYLTTEQGCDTSLTACTIPLEKIRSHSTQCPQPRNLESDLLLTHHPLIPYLIPYTMYWGCLAFEMINSFSGSHWGYVSLPANSDVVSSDLWNFSCEIINNSFEGNDERRLS
jgi:NAD(P)-dependent dehydrogenase (short-subunit alcohol dehydrogenase family)